MMFVGLYVCLYAPFCLQQHNGVSQFYNRQEEPVLTVHYILYVVVQV